ncbi:MAG: Na+/H+ antiporter NhaA [Nitrospira sp.]|nr:Na+/H+ antiporter NhaA [Nitrospira sp.]
MSTISETASSDRRAPIQKALEPLHSFVRHEATGGIVLMLATAVALGWVNSPWNASYDRLWQVPIGISIGEFELAKPLLLWINDGLMAMFFFVVGLEIKREFLVGELAEPRQAILPIAGAIGGMVAPALLYLAFNHGTRTGSGWGIPMATDIAFAIGIMALLGKRVPWSLKIFLISLAIVDDLGAVLVIALFYTSDISVGNLVVGLGFLVALVVANLAGIKHPLVYSVLGIGGLWLAFLLSGVHATVAGVLAAMTIPARPRLSQSELVQKGEHFLEKIKRSDPDGDGVLADPQKAETSQALETSTALAQTPLQRLEHSLQPWVALGVMPLFALANAGVILHIDPATMFTEMVSLGIVAGLLLGKPGGIMLALWLCVRTGLAELPGHTTWRQVFGISALAGVGFTMSLFIANLAFREGEVLELAKISILLASLLAGLGGWALLASTAPNKVEGDDLG